MGLIILGNSPILTVKNLIKKDKDLYQILEL